MSKIVDIAGETFGRLMVTGRAANNHGGKARWECVCECGNSAVVVGEKLRRGHTKSCGCLVREVRDGFRRHDLTGQTFGLLTVVAFSHLGENGDKGAAFWTCVCECGNTTIAKARRLKSGEKKSCGCLGSKNHVRGEKHHNWSSNLTDGDRKNRRQSREHRLWTRAILERDDFACVLCGSTKNLLAHHKDGYGWCKERRLDLSNGATLCRSCHIAFHVKYGYTDNTEKQFEEFSGFGNNCIQFFGFDAVSGAYLEWSAGGSFNFFVSDQPLSRPDSKPLGEATIEEIQGESQ